MDYETTDPPGAKTLLEADQGWTYLDVRTEEEFRAGHVPGSWNVPVLFRDPAQGMRPNPDFEAVVAHHFGPETPLVVGCAAGKRSALACERLAEAGFGRLVNMDGGFSGARGRHGEVLVEGWQSRGYPVEDGPGGGRSWSDLRP